MGKTLLIFFESSWPEAISPSVHVIWNPFLDWKLHVFKKLWTQQRKHNPSRPRSHRLAARLLQNAQRPTVNRGPLWMLTELAVSAISPWTLPAWVQHEAEQPDVVLARHEVQAQQHEAELRRAAEEAQRAAAARHVPSAPREPPEPPELHEPEPAQREKQVQNVPWALRVRQE